MRIAQVSPLYESVPPKLYGGTERVVAYLTQELVCLGHDVTLFASGDSSTDARLIAPVEKALRTNSECIDGIAHHVFMLELVAQHAKEFDIVHFHVDYLHFPLSRRLGYRHMTTLHGRLDLSDLKPIFSEFSDMPVVSISEDQKIPLPEVNWAGTVHHGIPKDLHKFSERPEGYLAFLGRISPEKRPDLAIEIARRAGKKIRIAAKVDKADKEYFKREIEPLLSSPHVEFLGEIGEREKTAFLGGADALLFPIDWPEPFGLAVIESLACGTPVIAFNRGSVSEILEDGVTGFIVQDVEGAVQGVKKIRHIERKTCRRVFEARFTSSRMASDYEILYNRLLSSDAHAIGPFC